MRVEGSSGFGTKTVFRHEQRGAASLENRMTNVQWAALLPSCESSTRPALLAGLEILVGKLSDRRVHGLATISRNLFEACIETGEQNPVRHCCNAPAVS